MVVAELVPVFLVGGPDASSAAGVEPDRSLLTADDAFCGNDVPDVFGNDVGSEEIEVAAFVGQAAGGMNMAIVAALVMPAGGGFYLHAHEVAVGFYHGVVGGGFSPGIKYLEAMFGGCGYELQLGPFAAALAVFDLDFYSG